MAQSIGELIQEYRIVVRPSLMRGGQLRFCAAMLRRVHLLGDRWDVWQQTYCEAETLEGAVNACAEKCKVFVESGEHSRALEA